MITFYLDMLKDRVKSTPWHSRFITGEKEWWPSENTEIAWEETWVHQQPIIISSLDLWLCFHQILHGNSDTFNVATNKLNPPLIASAIRIYPYSNHSRTVCLRLGLNGCVFEGDEWQYFLFENYLTAENLLSYDVPQGMVRGATLELLDITYDGLEDSLTGFLTGGLGQLTDGKYGLENYRAVGENGLVRGSESLHHLNHFKF